MDTDIQKKLKQFFEQLPKDRKPTANDIGQAARKTGYLPELIPAMMAYAEANEINPEREIEELHAASEKAKAESAAALARERIIQTAGEIEALAGSLKTETDPAKIQDIKNSIDNARARMDVSAQKSPFITFDQYVEKLINKNWWEEFRPTLYNRLPYPDGTFSAIGAPPGGGKTAGLINLGRELLITPPPENPVYEKAQAKNAKRNILYLSAEMTIEAITDRLIQCIAWEIGRGNPRYDLENVKEAWDYEQRVKDIYRGSGELIAHNEKEAARAELYKRVHDEYIRPAWGKRLQIAYLRGYQFFDDIANIIKTKAEPGTVVLMDYIQLFPPTKKDIGDWGDKCPRYLQIRHVIDEVILAAEQTKSVVICAAQLGRTERQGGSERNADDTQGWRESGDIEQSAWNLIKMFLEVNENNPAEKQMSYRIAKARSSHHLGEAYILDWTPKYQHMENAMIPKPKIAPWRENEKVKGTAKKNQGNGNSGALGENKKPQTAADYWETMKGGNDG